MEIRQTILQGIDAAADQLIGLARRIHATPEIAFQELKASQWLSDTLESNRFAVQRGIAAAPTAFRAEVCGASGRPSGGCLGEYDWLRGPGHVGGPRRSR